MRTLPASILTGAHRRPDAELLELGEQHRALWLQLGDTCAAEIPARVGTPASCEFERKLEAVHAELIALEREIAALRASTFAGLAIKLRIAADDIDPFREGDLTTDELNLLSALKDAERLAAEGA